jgi:hypothetical protein
MDVNLVWVRCTALISLAVLEISMAIVHWYKRAWTLSSVARVGYPAWIRGPYVSVLFDTGNGVHWRLKCWYLCFIVCGGTSRFYLDKMLSFCHRFSASMSVVLQLQECLLINIEWSPIPPMAKAFQEFIRYRIRAASPFRPPCCRRHAVLML